MHDLKWIRENPQAFDTGLKRRGLEALSPKVLELDAARRAAQTAMQELQKKRNDTAKAIGQAKAKKDDAEFERLRQETDSLKGALQANEAKERLIADQLDELLAGIPNLPAADVPDGQDEHGNKEIRAWGQKPAFTFAPKEHFHLGEALKLMDFEAAARMSGARFVVLRGALARLERALGAFMLDVQREHGYEEINPPLLVRDEAAFGTGQLPKFREDLFKTGIHNFDKAQQWALHEYRKRLEDLECGGFIPKPPSTKEQKDQLGYEMLADLVGRIKAGDFDDPLWLIPTAEVPLTNLVREQILSPAELPMRVCALTPCFRAEAGSAGKDTRGMIRQHQFMKVEIVSIVTPDASALEHERLTGCAEDILKRLNLHYRVMALCTGDMGFAAQKTYDIEVWLPGQDRYREISSCSNFGDFQARRMNARFRPEGEKGTRFVHTLNGSGLAVGRTLVAVLESYQQADGTIEIPEALRPYLGGLNAIQAGGR